MQYVIIGNSAAGIGAVEGIRQKDKKGKIILLSNEFYHTYSRPLISYFLEGKVDIEAMRYRDYSFYSENNVEVMLGKKVASIDFNIKEIILESNERVSYDRLLIATGGKPFVPQMEGLGKAGIYTFIDLDSAKALKEAAFQGSKAVVIGAGLIGLKVAEALVKKGVEVSVVELSNRVFSSILDEKSSEIVKNHLEKKGIKLYLNNSVKSFNGDWAVNSVTLNDGQWLECNFAVVAIGVVPNIDIVKNSELKINRGIPVDKYMRTSIKNVYAAGDVCETIDLLTGVQRVIPILPGAYMQGETAGSNMAGARKEYDGSIPMNSISLLGLPMITAGMVKPEGEGFEVLEKRDSEKEEERKIILKNNRVVGYSLIKNIDRAGIITNLIKDRVNVESFKEKLLLNDFGYADMPKEYRKDKLLEGRKMVK